MRDKNANSLVERYYTWEKLVLITALLLIFWKAFGLINTTTLPLLNAVLHDPNKFPHATCIILMIELFFMWIEWKQSDSAAREAKLSKVRCSTMFIIAFIAMWINVPALTKGTALDGVSQFWYVFYFLIGLIIAFFSSVIVLATLMIRTETNGKRFPFASIPIATICIYKAYWPVVLALLILSYAVSCYAPSPILQVAPWITALPISLIFIGEVTRYFFAYDEHGRRISFRQNISALKEVFKTHDYLYYISARGKRLVEQTGVPLTTTPQEQQRALRQHFSKDSGNVELRSRTLERFDFVTYSKDGDSNNRSPENIAVRIVLENPKAAGLKVQVFSKDEDPPKNVRELILKVSFLEKHANDFLLKNLGKTITLQALFSYTIDHSVSEIMMEKADEVFPLHDAAFIGRQDLIEQFLAKGKSINEQADNGWTPLLAAVAQGYPKIVKFMLERGANPDIPNLQKITPLMYAARYGNLEIAKMLLDFGAALDFADIYGETALAVAVRTGQESLVKLLISKGAKVDTRSTLENLSPLDLAHRLGHGKIARLLRKVKN